jgi:hypothetical protein
MKQGIVTRAFGWMAGAMVLIAGVPAAAQDASASAAGAAEAIDTTRVYRLNLTGWFGEDISQTPIEQCLKDAKKNGAELIVVYIDNDLSLKRFNRLEDIKDEEGNFDQIVRAMDIVPQFGEKLRTWWPDHPRIVYWVKTAMGGACFLPMSKPDIYMHSEGKLGGIGHMSNQFDGVGDERVRQKQYSLRMAWAEGLGALGGYDGRILRAMARDEYVLSYKMEGGRPVFLERTPQNPDEVLLTDDGKDTNEDTIEQLARFKGNDCLTLYPELARELSVSKATVDTFDDLMHELGLGRTAEFIETSNAQDAKAKISSRGSGRSDQLMKTWRDGVVNGKRDLRRMIQEFAGIEVTGNYDERKRARGRKMRLIDDMVKLIRQYQEAINPRQIGVPEEGDLLAIRKQIELDQLGDRR